MYVHLYKNNIHLVKIPAKKNIPAYDLKFENNLSYFQSSDTPYLNSRKNWNSQKNL
jgi:hypothetical protein